MAVAHYDILAAAHTAHGYRSYYAKWLKNARHIIALKGHYVTISAVLTAFADNLDGIELWRFHEPLNPNLLTGLVIPSRHTAIIMDHSSWQISGVTAVIDTVSLDAPTVRYPSLPPDVYRHLRIASDYLQDIREFWRTVPQLSAAVHDVQQRLLEMVSVCPIPKAGQSFHAFGTALSSQGPYSPVTDASWPAKRRHLLISPPGSEIHALMAAVGKRALASGHSVLFLHCGINPDHFDHLYLPQSQWLISHCVAPHWQTPHTTDVTYDLTQASLTAGARDELDNLYFLYAQAYHKAWARIAETMSPPTPVPAEEVQRGVQKVSDELSRHLTLSG
ncbi:hypothetical protein [Sulfobacillus sp. hq2]|uniref:hypothetical protein n=1 Tax=Sulfobacillus TaxID=28033 RepID=UPI000CD217C1|nr:hypothetical protein [Sulfobacillus sp. hq2]POB10625.1 hypothetical protein CO251_07265 [Sulfobacillus sp. hq2]